MHPINPIVPLSQCRKVQDKQIQQLAHVALNCCSKVEKGHGRHLNGLHLKVRWEDQDKGLSMVLMLCLVFLSPVRKLSRSTVLVYVYLESDMC